MAPQGGPTVTQELHSPPAAGPLDTLCSSRSTS
eukprot:CAMPEP_0171879888 /NCGR_PEP_ID=MMETSP0992-20121227/38124_1 /TAXON_ID=483369 /ORGANISM="non described non described, Strain CCMP2098" /LENGTH=32 /DNA_ID= /DNA_START= /DNA_END= /DNA_ORIENTATION=